MFEAPPLTQLQEAIASPNNPIGMRMRASYYLKQAYENYMKNFEEKEVTTNYDDDDDDDDDRTSIDKIVIETLCAGLNDKRHGSLLRHEFAYVMGQIRDERVSLAKKFHERISRHL